MVTTSSHFFIKIEVSKLLYDKDEENLTDLGVKKVLE